MIGWLTPRDVHGLFQIIQLSYNSGEWPIGGGWTLAQLLEELQNSGGIGWRDPQSQEVVSFILYTTQPALYEVTVLATHPDFRRRGLMEKLLRHLMGQLQAGERIWLEVHERNLGAHNLYKKLGFEQQGKRPKYYRDGGAAWLFSFIQEGR